MSEEDYLRRKAREAIRAGKLPDRAPDQVWGGPGTGATCAVCGASTTHGEVELEIEFLSEDRPAPQTYLVHLRCYSLLEVERQADLAPAVRPASRATLPVRRNGSPS